MQTSPLWRVAPDDPQYRALAAAEAEYWSKPHPFGLESNAEMEEGDADRINNACFTGRRDLHWEETIQAHGPFRSGLVLGTSELMIERRIVATNPTAHFIFLDISEGAVERRQRILGAEFPGRVATRVADLNFAELEPESCDVIVSCASLHHVTNLEYCASQINAALKPGGYFFLNDWVGENRFEFTPARMALYEGIVDRDIARTPGRTRGLAWLDATSLSPFCAVRSIDMLPILRERLEEVETRAANAFFVCLMRSFPSQPPALTTNLARRAYNALRWREIRLVSSRSPRPAVSKQLLADLVLVDEVLRAAEVLPPGVVFSTFRKRV